MLYAADIITRAAESESESESESAGVDSFGRSRSRSRYFFADSDSGPESESVFASEYILDEFCRSVRFYSFQSPCIRPTKVKRTSGYAI